MNKEKIKIFAVSHQLLPYNIYQSEFYYPLYTGAIHKNGIFLNEEGYRDDSGIQISDKNSEYAELTGHYWIWKNVKTEIVGLVHYRRYFVQDAFMQKVRKKTFQIRNVYFYKPLEKKMNPYDFIIDEEQLSDMFGQTQIYVAENTNSRMTVREVFINSFGRDFCSQIEKVIENKYPDYFDSLCQVFDSHTYFMCNMFIAEKDIMDKYWEWLFSILGKLEQSGMKFRFKSYTGHDKRYAFAGELLFRVWVIKNNITYKGLDVVQLGRSVPDIENPRIYRIHDIFKIMLGKLCKKNQYFSDNNL